MHVTSGAAVGLEIDGRFAYGVGLRILTDRRLLRQVRDELRTCAMAAADIARLENVTPEVLLQVVEAGLAPGEDPSWPLRAYARAHAGFETAAWVNTRGHLSKRHIINPSGVALCGIPLLPGRELLDGGPCRTCAERAGVAAAS